MGELTTIGFRPGSSPLHRLDPRTKQLLLFVLSLISLHSSITFLILSSATLLILFYAANLRIRRLVFEIRYFLFFLLMIFLVRAVTVTDGWLPTMASEKKVWEAVVICWRLLLVVVMGLLLIATTRMAHIRAALIWLLKPLPLVNDKMAATMVGLVVRFLPLILLQAGEISDALRARGIEKRKNPMARLVKFAIPLFRRVFLRADELTETMQSRCYNEQRTIPQLTFSRQDGLAAAIGLFLSLAVLLP